MRNASTDWTSLIREHRLTLAGRGFSPRTIAGRTSMLAAAGRWFAQQGLTEAVRLRRGDLEAYRTHLAVSMVVRRCPATCRNHLTALRVLYRELQRSGAIEHDPMVGLELPTAPRPLPRTILSQSQLNAVRHHASHGRCNRLRDRAIVETLYATGIRRAECAQLEVGDADPQRRTLTVRHGKGRRQRVVPIADAALGWIAAYLRRERRLKRREITANSPLFAGRAGRALSPGRIAERIRDIMNAAGIPAPGACHLFRHAMATHMLDNGADIRFIQAMLGHADISTTMVYTHVSIRGLAEVYRRTHPMANIGPSTRALT